MQFLGGNAESEAIGRHDIIPLLIRPKHPGQLRAGIVYGANIRGRSQYLSLSSHRTAIGYSYALGIFGLQFTIGKRLGRTIVLLRIAKICLRQEAAQQRCRMIFIDTPDSIRSADGTYRIIAKVIAVCSPIRISGSLGHLLPVPASAIFIVPALQPAEGRAIPVIGRIKGICNITWRHGASAGGSHDAAIAHIVDIIDLDAHIDIIADAASQNAANGADITIIRVSSDLSGVIRIDHRQRLGTGKTYQTAITIELTITIRASRIYASHRDIAGIIVFRERNGIRAITAKMSQDTANKYAGILPAGSYVTRKRDIDSTGIKGPRDIGSFSAHTAQTAANTTYIQFIIVI